MSASVAASVGAYVALMHNKKMNEIDDFPVDQPSIITNKQRVQTNVEKRKLLNEHIEIVYDWDKIVYNWNNPDSI